MPSECIDTHLIIYCSVVFLLNFSGQYLNKSKRIGCFFMALYNFFRCCFVFQGSRFEVKWCKSVLCLQEAEALVTTVLPSDRHDAAPEIAVYLKESVGNSTRIDYGTGLCLNICVYCNCISYMFVCGCFSIVVFEEKCHFYVLILSIFNCHIKASTILSNFYFEKVSCFMDHFHRLFPQLLTL